MEHQKGAMSDVFHALLKQYFGYSGFRPHQLEVISSVVAKKDTLALLPTGGGKSLCYQIPSLSQDGLCIVISPLIALMKDQVDALKRKKIRAYAIHSGMTSREIDIALDNSAYGQAKFLYVSPERLKTDLFRERLQNMNVNLLAVDEAHCISQWGHDFRPPYLEIAEIRQYLPGVPCLALTATATPQVQGDIASILGLQSPSIIVGDFQRTNLSLSVRCTFKKPEKLLEILDHVPGAAIIYVRSRKKCKEISMFLNKNGITSDYYHAGLGHDVREMKQEAWVSGINRVIVATNAFGMGIDKADVRSVIHIDLPEDLESYYQEAGRAGRDGHKSFAVALYNESDVLSLKNAHEVGFPTIDFLKKVYQALANYFKMAVGSSALSSFDFDLEIFCRNFNLPQYQTYQAIKRLQEQGLVEMNDSFYHPSKIVVNVSKEKLYEYQIANEGMDNLIKLLMRLFGGELFSNFVAIKENVLAKYLNLSSFQVVQRLTSMHDNNIITYDKIKDKPQILFLTPRQDANQLQINAENYLARKKNKEGKLQKVTGYVENDDTCRMSFITEYFGQEDNVDCGMCDVCIGKRKIQQGISAEIVLEILGNGGMSFEELVEKMGVRKKDLESIVRMLLDDDKVYYDNFMKLIVKN